MKTVLLLSILLWAASAAPAEDTEKAPEAAVDAPQGQMAAAPEMEDKMVKYEDVFVPQDFVPVPKNAPASKEAAATESRYNFCPTGWFSFGSRCFMFSTSAMNWYSAEEYCNGLGAHLASATNPQEDRFLQQLTQTAGHSVAWLGGFDLEGKWMWIDRQGFYYDNWYENNNYHHCLYIRSDGGWSNRACATAYHFICSRNAFGC